MNLAHAANRCSGPTAPPSQWRCLHRCNITETIVGVSASIHTFREQARNHNGVTCGGCNCTTAASIRQFVWNDCNTAPSPAFTATQLTSLPEQATRRSAVFYHYCTCTPSQSPISRFVSTKTPPMLANSTDPAMECRRSRDKTAWAKPPTQGWQHRHLHHSGDEPPSKGTTPFPGFCAIRAGRHTNQIGGGFLILIQYDLVFQTTE